jgi:integrase
MLPLLVERAQNSYEHARDLLALAGATEPDALLEFRGRRYRRLWTRNDQTRFAGDGHANVRVRDEATGEVTNLDAAEDAAFWTWAVVQVLRLTGIRHEELLELTHLSIRQYQRPNGEVVALLVIAPSKTDRERVIPVSAELFAVLAAIIRRHTRAGRPVPVVTRWDSHEREHSPPLPFLFQRQNGARHAACSMAWIAGLLDRCCASLARQHSQFAGITLTPHDFRRLFATDLVNNGLHIHLGAALLGHTNLQTTRGYVAVVDEDLIRHYQTFLDRRRTQRPATSTGPPPPRSGSSSNGTSTSARSSSATAAAPTPPPAPTNTPASAAPCCTSTRPC